MFPPVSWPLPPSLASCPLSSGKVRHAEGPPVACFRVRDSILSDKVETQAQKCVYVILRSYFTASVQGHSGQQPSAPTLNKYKRVSWVCISLEKQRDLLKDWLPRPGSCRSGPGRRAEWSRGSTGPASSRSLRSGGWAAGRAPATREASAHWTRPTHIGRVMCFSRSLLT